MQNILMRVVRRADPDTNMELGGKVNWVVGQVFFRSPTLEKFPSISE